MTEASQSPFDPQPRRQFLRHLGLGAGVAAYAPFASPAQAQPSPPAEMRFVRQPDLLQLQLGDRPIAGYRLRPLPIGGPSVDSAAYLHPLCTPSGLCVTEVAPADHRYHRGVFLAWPKVIGHAIANFWGGASPSTRGCRIVHRTLDAPNPALGYSRFRATNEWLVEKSVILTEEIAVSITQEDHATHVNFTARLTALTDIRLARSPFGGFAVRTRADGQPVAIGPAGDPPRKPSDPAQTDSNWPDAPWRGLRLQWGADKTATVVVVGRHTNPPTTWHVIPSSGLLNPCITASDDVRIPPDQPLLLRYRIMAFDGAPDLARIARWADPWYHA